MSIWLFCHTHRAAMPHRSWHQTYEAGVSALLEALREREAEGMSIDPALVSGTLEHRYSVTDGCKLVAVYWLSKHEVSPY